jgi:prepilin-type N-terminal cleavage/methylation domain-containing protein
MDDLFNRAAQRRRRGQGGFTLIELLVVIAVLAILAGIVIFNVTGVADKGKTASCQTDVKSVQTAVDAFYNAQTTAAYPFTTSTPTTPTDPMGGLVPKYLHTAPIDVGTLTVDASGTVTSTACTP